MLYHNQCGAIYPNSDAISSYHMLVYRNWCGAINCNGDANTTMAGWKSGEEVRALAKDRDKWKKSTAAFNVQQTAKRIGDVRMPIHRTTCCYMVADKATLCIS